MIKLKSRNTGNGTTFECGFILHSEAFKYDTTLFINLLRKEFYFNFTAELVENDDNGYEYDEIGNNFFCFATILAITLFLHLTN